MGLWAPGPGTQGPGAKAWDWDLEGLGPRLGLGLGLGQKPRNVAGLPEKHDSAMKMQDFCLCLSKSHQKPCVFEPRLEKHIKNFVFLNVQTRNCVRGRSFQITKRSTSIGVSISSQNVGSRLGPGPGPLDRARAQGRVPGPQAHPTAR